MAVKSNCEDKWAKLLAAKRYHSDTGKVTLDILEQQELLDDIRKEFELKNNKYK